jgi:hypothetical protein
VDLPEPVGKTDWINPTSGSIGERPDFETGCRKPQILYLPDTNPIWDKENKRGT